MVKTQRCYLEQGRRAQRRLRQGLRNQIAAEIADARARDNPANNRMEQDDDLHEEVGEIIGQVQGDAEVENQVGRQAVPAEAVVEPPRPNPEGPNIAARQEQDQGEGNQPINNMNGERLVDEGEENNPYDNEHGLSADEASDEDGGEEEMFGNQRLYEGATITVRESMVMLLNHMLNHNLTGTCMEDFLEILNYHCPAAGFHRYSYFKFRKFFKSGKLEMKKKFYCSFCFTSLGAENEQCPTCRVDRDKAYFVQLPLIPQMRELYKRPAFYNSLQHRHARARDAGRNFLEDIYDGSVYQEQVRAGFLSDPNNISFTWYTDGAPVFTSRNYSIWPFLFMINELPYNERTSRENILMAGLWFGPHKPAVNMFLRSFLPDLRALYRGVNFNIADIGLNIPTQVRAIVLAGVCDTPAKTAFFNFNAHNGFHGCTFCEIRGETYNIPQPPPQPEQGPVGNQPAAARNKHKHTYPYEERLILRSITTYGAKARQAINSVDPIDGIKGPTALHLFMPDFLKGGAIDPMHLVTGVTKKLLKLHFSEKCGREPFSIRDLLNICDEALLRIKPPKFIHRRPQSLEDYHRWKASQLMAWLVFFSIPIYRAYLPLHYFNHYLKFVAAISLLNGNMVSRPDIDRAERLLKEFVREFQQLYGIRFCTINIHLLLHLPECVRRLGPLWVYTCFPMENLNGLMLANIHGKTSVDSQLCTTFWNVLCQHRYLAAIPDGPKKEFITKRRKALKILDRIAPGCYSVGKYIEPCALDQNVIRNLQANHVNAGNITLYLRLLKDRLIYMSQRYERNLASQSSHVLYEYRGRTHYGTIEVFIFAQCNCEGICECVTGHFAVIHEIRTVDTIRIPHYPNHPLNHIRQCERTDNLHVVRVDQLKTVCVYMSVLNKNYIAKPLNSNEVE